MANPSSANVDMLALERLEQAVQRVLMEQPRPFDVDVAEAAFASQ